MKVLYITGMDSTKYGGLEKYNLELVEKGVALSLVYNSIPKSKAYLEDLKRYKVPVYIVGGGVVSRIIQIVKIIKKENPTIIHYHFGKLIYMLAPLCFILFPKLKQVYTIHCEFPRLNKMDKCLMNLCVRCLDTIICVSEGVKNGLIKRIKNNNKIIVSYLGVKKRPLKELNLKKELQIEDNTVVLTSIGFDIIVKGYDLLAKAVSRLNRMNNVPPYKILIVGLSQSEESRFYEILSQLKLQEYFISIGIVDNIDDYLNISDIYLQPSRSEAISLSIMEALQYELPIIGTNTGGIPEVCLNNENGYLFNNGDVDALTMVMYKLIGSPELRERFGRQSMKLSSKFRVDYSATQLLQIYNSLGNCSR